MTKRRARNKGGQHVHVMRSGDKLTNNIVIRKFNKEVCFYCC